jgi:membrane fusion protein (multidrug efflux system)
MRVLTRKMAARWALLALPAFLSPLSCARKTQPPAAPPTVEVAPAVQKDIPITTEWVGSLDGYVNAEIRPQVEGYLLRLDYREGSFVRRGGLLFEIDPRQFQAALDQAKADLARAQAAEERARLDVSRFTPLVAEKAISQQELDNALSNERQAQANVQAARAAVDRARLNLEWTRVTSPIDGIAGIAKAQTGNLVNSQTVMTTVSQVDPIKAYFSPSEQEYMAWSQSGGIVGARKGALQLILANGTQYPYRGDPVIQDRSVDPRTGTITVAGVFPNPDRLLRPGQFAKVRAVTRTVQGALLVPQRAVSELQGNFQIAVVGPDNKVDVRTVEMGERVESLWLVTKGLSPGDRVVVEGVQKVKAGMVVDPKPVPAAAAEPSTTAAPAAAPTAPSSAGGGR